MNPVEIVAEQLYTIEQICRIFQLSRVYVHRYVTMGKLVAHKEPMPNRESGERWVCLGSDILEWRKHAKANKRSDGKSRFVLHAPQAQIEAIKAKLQEEGFDFEVSKQNQAKKANS